MRPAIGPAEAAKVADRDLFHRLLVRAERGQIQKWKAWCPPQMENPDSPEATAAIRAHFADRVAEAKRLAEHFSRPSDDFRSEFFELQFALSTAILAEWDASQRSPSPAPDAVLAAVATAQALRIAIDALPVGKDIRTRLLVHVDAHVSALEALRP